MQSINNRERELTHIYQAELHGDALQVRMDTTGGFASVEPQEFTMKRNGSTH